MRATNPAAVARLLGYAGLLPFLVPAALVLLESEHAPLASAIAASYALAILCFLCGSWWGMAQASCLSATLLLSNAYLLLALALYLFTPELWALAAALLFVGAWLCEQRASLFPAYPEEYRRLRTILTLGASASMTALYLHG